MNNVLHVPLHIAALKSLRGNQAKALAYIYSVIKTKPNHCFTTAELERVLGITRQGAWKLLNRLTELGFLNHNGNFKITRTDHTQQRDTKIPYVWSKGQTHFFVSSFSAIIDTIKSLFTSNESLPTNLNKDYNNTNNNQCTNNGGIIKSHWKDKESRREQYRVWIEAGRSDLWEQDVAEYSKMKDAEDKLTLTKMMRERGWSETQIVERLEEIYGNATVPVEVEKEKDVSILAWMTEPLLIELSDEMDKVEEILADLEVQRNVWTNRQKGFWVGLKKKQATLCRRLQDVLSPWFDFKKLYEPTELMYNL